MVFDIFWLLVSMAFFWFGFIFWQYSNSPLRSFTVRVKGDDPENSSLDEETTQIIEYIKEDIGGYLKTANETMKMRFRIGAYGFLVSGLAALAGMFVG